MKRQHVILLGVLAALIALPTVASDDVGPGAELRIRGQVIAVEHQPDDAGTMQTRIRVRTRAREEHTLQLGPRAEWGDSFQVGDQIRARYRFSDGEGSGQMLRIRNRNTGETMQGQGDGTMVRVRERTRTRTALGMQGNGGGPGGGGSGGGSAGNRGGGGGRGGR